MESFVKDGKGLGWREKLNCDFPPKKRRSHGPPLHALLCWPSYEVRCIEGRLHSFSDSLALTPASLKSAAKICISLRCKFPNYI